MFLAFLCHFNSTAVVVHIVGLLNGWITFWHILAFIEKTGCGMALGICTVKWKKKGKAGRYMCGLVG